MEIIYKRGQEYSIKAVATGLVTNRVHGRFLKYVKPPNKSDGEVCHVMAYNVDLISSLNI